MDFSSIIGWVIGFAVIVYGIGMDKIGNFMDGPSALIVVGGTICAVIASFPFQQLKNVGIHMKMLFQGKKFNPDSTIEKLVELAQAARKEGLLSLEERAREMEDPFFRKSLLLIVDAMDEEKVRTMLEDEVACMEARHDTGAGIYDKAAAFAPAFGMIGTLVGLINMLKEMNLEDGASSALGEQMSIALVTTFYGCILANLIFMPIAKKLRTRNEEEVLYRQIIIEGVLGIQAGDNPKVLREKLVSYLRQRQQSRLLDEEGSEGKKSRKEKRVK